MKQDKEETPAQRPKTFAWSAVAAVNLKTDCPEKTPAARRESCWASATPIHPRWTCTVSAQPFEPQSRRMSHAVHSGRRQSSRKHACTLVLQLKRSAAQMCAALPTYQITLACRIS